MARFCNKCNYPIEEGGNYCTECGGNDIRDDSVQEKNILEEEKKEEDTPEPIPELDTEMVRSFGDQSIENLQKNEIKSINDSELNSNEDEKTTDSEKKEKQETFTKQEIQEASSLISNKHNHTKKNSNDIEIPEELQIKEKDSTNDTNNEIKDDSSNETEQPSNTPEKRLITNNMKKKKKKNKKEMTTIAIIAGSIVTLIIIFFIILPMNRKPENEYPFTMDDINNINNSGNIFDYTTIFKPDNSFRVGTEGIGFVSIPKTWSQISQAEGSPILQYTDNTSWVVTIMSIPTNQFSAVNYANSVYHSVKENGGQNITTGTTSIAGYPALTITATYPNLNKYLTTWCFESTIGKTHYLAIEGPSPSGDNYNIIYSFRENK